MTCSGELCGRNALVTGAAKRIGREIALALADAGVNVAVHYRNSGAEAEALCGELVGKEVKAWPVRADLSDPDSLATLIPAVCEMAGSLDFLVNNASLFVPGELLGIGEADLARDLRVNAWAPFLLGREFFKRTGAGRIINVLDSRIAGFDLSHASYALSKSLFAELTEMMALAFAPAMTVNAVAPGIILPPPGKDDFYLDTLAAGIPLRRHGAASDVAGAALYLLGADYVTGQVLFVDGGQSLTRRRYG